MSAAYAVKLQNEAKLPQSGDDDLSDVSLQTFGGYFVISIDALLANDKGGAGKSFYGVVGLTEGTDWYVSADGKTLYVRSGLESFDYLSQMGKNGALSSATVELPEPSGGEGDNPPSEVDFNGGFEAPNPAPSTGGYGAATIPLWTNAGDPDDQFEVWTSGMGGITPSEESHFIELDKDGGLDIISTVGLDVTDGATYELTFDFASRPGLGRSDPTDTFEVYWNGEWVATIDPTRSEWTEAKYSVVGRDGEDVLQFRELASGNDTLGALLDNAHLILV